MLFCELLKHLSDFREHLLRIQRLLFYFLFRFDFWMLLLLLWQHLLFLVILKKDLLRRFSLCLFDLLIDSLARQRYLLFLRSLLFRSLTAALPLWLLFTLPLLWHLCRNRVGRDWFGGHCRGRSWTGVTLALVFALAVFYVVK